MIILAMDISGNFKEGKGTTGLCVLEDGKPLELAEIKARHFDKAESYWNMHIEAIKLAKPDVVVMEGYRLYNHRGMKAKTQANSELETPQLIGAIRLFCHKENIPLVIQYAHEVKSRWSDKVLQANRILDERNHFKGLATNNHKRDALRHALHYWRYKVNGVG